MSRRFAGHWFHRRDQRLSVRPGAASSADRRADGASAVLLFAVPASPLAQPWSIIGGNTISALMGIIAAYFIRDPIIATGVGVSLAIGAMSFTRCLHPPGEPPP